MFPKKRMGQPDIDLWMTAIRKGYSLSGNIAISLGNWNTQDHYFKKWWFEPSSETLFGFNVSTHGSDTVEHPAFQSEAAQSLHLTSRLPY